MIMNKYLFEKLSEKDKQDYVSKVVQQKNVYLISSIFADLFMKGFALALIVVPLWKIAFGPSGFYASLIGFVTFLKIILSFTVIFLVVDLIQLIVRLFKVKAITREYMLKALKKRRK